MATVKMFLVQILFGNVACQFVPHLAGKDLNGVAELHPELAAGDVLVGDRAFGSCGHLALLVSTRVRIAGLEAAQRQGAPLVMPFGKTPIIEGNR